VSGSGLRIFASSSIADVISDGSPRRERPGRPVAPTMSPRSRSSCCSEISWMRPERSTRSRKVSFPISRRAMTRPATRTSSSSVSPFSAFSAAARTATISSRSGNRFGSIVLASLRRSLATPTVEAAPASAGVAVLRGLDFQDLELHRPARGRDLDGLALLLADDRLADGRLVRELVLGGVRLGGADDPVLDRLLRVDVAQLHLGADRDDVLGDVLLGDHARVAEPLLERGDAVLEQRLLVLGVVVLGVLGDVAELAGDADAVGDLATLVVRQVLDLLLQLLVAFGSEDDVLQRAS